MQITYVLSNTATTNSGLRSVSVAQFNNGSVIAMLTVNYDSSSSVSAIEIDGVLTSYALSNSLTDGTDSITVRAGTIIGKKIM